MWFGLQDELIIANIHTMIRLTRHNDIESIVGIPTAFYNLNELNFVQENFSECLRSFKTTLMDYCVKKEQLFIDFSLNLNIDCFLEDGLHPNEKGHKMMGENAITDLVKIIAL